MDIDPRQSLFFLSFALVANERLSVQQYVWRSSATIRPHMSVFHYW